MNTLNTFDIRNFLDRLTPVRDEKYICPVCANNNLSISAKTGKYQCWNGCDNKDIREAVSPWEEVKPTRLRAKTEYIYRDRDGQPCIKVTRRDDGEGHKQIFQSSWNGTNWEKGLTDTARKNVPIYRYREVREAIAQGKPVFVVEGEGVADCLWEKGIAATTTIGGAGKYRKYGSGYEQDLDEAEVLVLCPDRDEPGIKHMDDVAHDFPGAKWVYAFPSSPLWANPPKNGGLDLKDWIESGATKEQILAAVGDRRATLAVADAVPDTFDAEITEFNQHVIRWLYSDVPWICHADTLYKWVGTHYESVPDTEHIRQISAFANTFRVVGKGGKVSYPYAKPGAVRAALQWVKDNTAVSASLIDPPGLNCTNGVLELRWNCVSREPTVTWELVPHSPDKYYTYEPIATYDPDANPEHCDRLLAALDPAQLEIFLKTIAASLDLQTIRRYFGRLVRALLLKGDGSNGKDTLREIVSLMYGGKGLTGATLSDFAAYDEGRKFPLARTINCRVNWASENANATRLDKIQSLKAFITGDPLSYERKGKDEQEFVPKAIALFNCNDTPKMMGSLEAIKSRYGVLSFNKTFKIGADPSKGEIEAEPRFKYDPEFLKKDVLPAFLNKVLAALLSLVESGIDYASTESALAAIQAENSHLFQFAQDVGLGYDPNGHITAGEIWVQLEQWYVANGTLTYEENDKGKLKAIWAEQANPSDRNVRAVNQVIARFKQLFPKVKVVSVAHPSGKRAVQALQGLSFGVPTPISPSPTPIPHQFPHQQTLVNQGSHTTHTNTKYSGENEEILVTSSEQIQHSDLVAPLPASATSDQNLDEVPKTGVGGVETPENKAFTGVPTDVATGVEESKIGVEEDDRPQLKVGDRVAKADPLTEDDIQDFADMIRYAIAEPAATDGVQQTLLAFFSDTPQGKDRVWAALTPQERAAYKSLLSPVPPDDNPKARGLK
jgi:putative DNA primase/helicase